jgi:hypothetical protein
MAGFSPLKKEIAYEVISCPCRRQADVLTRTFSARAVATLAE